MGATERKTAVDMVPNYGITYAGAACPMADYAGAVCAGAAVSTCTVAMNPRKYVRLIFEYLIIFTKTTQVWRECFESAKALSIVVKP